MTGFDKYLKLLTNGEFLNMPTIYVCPYFLSDLWTYGISDSLLLSVQSQGGCGLQRHPLVPLPPVIGGVHQTGKTYSQLGHKGTNHEELNIMLFFWSVIYVGRYLANILNQTSCLGKMCLT